MTQVVSVKGPESNNNNDYGQIEQHQENHRRLVTWCWLWIVVNSLLKSLFSLTAKNQSMQLRRKEKPEKMTSRGVG